MLKLNRKIIAAGKGNVSKLIALEAHFLDIILHLALMRQPLTPHGVISLINSLVERSDLHHDIMQ
jgi:hypothetical protein